MNWLHLKTVIWYNFNVFIWCLWLWRVYTTIDFIRHTIDKHKSFFFFFQTKTDLSIEWILKPFGLDTKAILSKYRHRIWIHIALQSTLHTYTICYISNSNYWRLIFIFSFLSFHSFHLCFLFIYQISFPKRKSFYFDPIVFVLNNFHDWWENSIAGKVVDTSLNYISSAAIVFQYEFIIFVVYCF